MEGLLSNMGGGSDEKLRYFSQATLSACGISAHSGKVRIPAPVIDVIIKDMNMETKSIATNVQAFLNRTAREGEFYVISIANVKQFKYIVLLLGSSPGLFNRGETGEKSLGRQS